MTSFVSYHRCIVKEIRFFTPNRKGKDRVKWTKSNIRMSRLHVNITLRENTGDDDRHSQFLWISWRELRRDKRLTSVYSFTVSLSRLRTVRIPKFFSHPSWEHTRTQKIQKKIKSQLHRTTNRIRNISTIESTIIFCLKKITSFKCVPCQRQFKNEAIWRDFLFPGKQVKTVWETAAHERMFSKLIYPGQKKRHVSHSLTLTSKESSSSFSSWKIQNHDV